MLYIYKYVGQSVKCFLAWLAREIRKRGLRALQVRLENYLTRCCSIGLSYVGQAVLSETTGVQRSTFNVQRYSCQPATAAEFVSMLNGLIS
jgi:hypothetical protein